MSWIIILQVITIHAQANVITFKTIKRVHIKCIKNSKTNFLGIVALTLALTEDTITLLN